MSVLNIIHIILFTLRTLSSFSHIEILALIDFTHQSTQKITLLFFFRARNLNILFVECVARLVTDHSIVMINTHRNQALIMN
jgi:hypothetical protein